MYQFLKYELTPGEKYLGIATVKAFDKIILRYKIVPTKDGQSFFAAAASYKVPSPEGDRYIPSFTLDSISETEELMQVIRQGVRSSHAMPHSSQPRANTPYPNDDIPF